MCLVAPNDAPTVKSSLKDLPPISVRVRVRVRVGNRVGNRVKITV